MKPNKALIMAANSFLSALYEKQDMRFSHLLIYLGFPEHDIVRLKDHAHKLVHRSITLLKPIILSNDDRAYNLIIRRFGLSGQQPLTLQAIGDDFGLTRERIRQIEQDTLRLCREEHRLKAWEQSVKEFATRILNGNQEIRQQAKGKGKQYPKIPTAPENRVETSHPFSFSTKTDPHGNRFLYIKDVTMAGNDYGITLTDDTFLSFYQCFMNSIDHLGWKRITRSHEMAEIRKKYPRAYEKWTDAEDETLTEAFSRGADIQELAVLLQRQPGAIRSRLQKAGLLDSVEGA